MSILQRCPWAEKTDEYRDYHDREWGSPCHDDRKLFESLSLQIMQAGLTWSAILHRRPAFRIAFENFDIEKVAHFGEKKTISLLENQAIIRNRKKIDAIIHNAQCIQDINRHYGCFSEFLWEMFANKPICNHFEKISDIPASTALSDCFAKELKSQGLKFIGSTICYAFMQANGMVNDHLVNCPRWHQIQNKTHNKDAS